jgi:hypothetical protein
MCRRSRARQGSEEQDLPFLVSPNSVAASFLQLLHSLAFFSENMGEKRLMDWPRVAEIFSSALQVEQGHS